MTGGNLPVLVHNRQLPAPIANLNTVALNLPVGGCLFAAFVDVYDITLPAG